MNTIFKYAPFAFFLGAVLTGCVTAENQVLDDSAQLAVEEPPEIGKPVLTSNKGVIEDFKGEIYSWWVANDKIAIAKVQDTLRVNIKNAGSKYECWGRQFGILDMREAPVLKIRMRYEGQLTPTISVHMKDNNGYDANANAPTARLKKGGYRDYYFNFKDRWKQSWPDDRPVDPTMIAELLFFVNPGAADWTGVLYIDDVVAVRPEDIPSKEPKKVDSVAVEQPKVETVITAGKIIDQFNEPINSWWSGSDKIALAKEEETLKVTAANAGVSYETFGRGFQAIDFNQTPIVKVRVKADQAVKLRVDLKDSDGRGTNKSPLVQSVQTGTDFVDLYYDFTGKYAQSYPDEQTVNPSQITDILFFLNPGGPAYTGTLYIDDISVMSVEDYNKIKK